MSWSNKNSAECQECQKAVARAQKAEAEVAELREMIKGRIQAVEMQPGDTVILQHQGLIGKKAARRIISDAMRILGVKSVIVLEDGMTMGVLRKVGG